MDAKVPVDPSADRPDQAGDAPLCRICGARTEALYQSVSEVALLSSARPVRGSTVVHLCPACAHAQTKPLMDLSNYYSSDYQFRTRSDDEDDLYDRVDDRIIYRSEHQANVAERKIDFARPMRVIDYGCGKALSLRLLAARHPKIRPHVFDVSDSYRKYWNEFVPSEQQASFKVPEGWLGAMDAVLSFFALEHVEDPHGFVTELRCLLRPGGEIFVIVPNVLRNISDLLVVDHVSHFSSASLTTLLAGHGFVGISIDCDAFRGAFVVRAILDSGDGAESAKPASLADLTALREVADFWREATSRIQKTEADSHGGRSAIYGSGIYGQFIASVLGDCGLVSCFIDQNPFRQGTSYMNIPVIAPAEVGDDVRLIYVGLNPALARHAIAGVKSLHEISREYFYL